jgi:hypothetical protein
MLDPDFLREQAAVARRLAKNCPWPDLRKQLAEIAAEFERRANELGRQPTPSNGN